MGKDLASWGMEGATSDEFLSCFTHQKKALTSYWVMLIPNVARSRQVSGSPDDQVMVLDQRVQPALLAARIQHDGDSVGVACG